MRSVRLFWKLYPSYFLITLLSLLLAGWLVSGTLRDFHINQVSMDLEAKAQLISHSLAEGVLMPADPDSAEAYCMKMGKLISTRITVILPDGVVAYDSEKDPKLMDNHADRPEVKKALSGEVGTSIRYSHTLGTDMMYVAVPVRRDPKTVAVVRAAMPLSAINSALNDIRKKALTGGVAAILLAVILCFIISRRISRPLEELTREVERFPKGDVGRGLVIPGTPFKELTILAGAINRMAAELKEQMKTIAEHRGKLEAILSSMSEGVIALDKENRIVILNKSAGKLLDVDPGASGGQFFEAYVRNPALQELTEKVMATGDYVEKEISRPAGGRAILRAHGVPLYGSSEDEKIGVLMVLDDITRLRRMEQVQKEFVANVSHELKTPITAIKGFAETLLDGAICDAGNAERFLRIIAVHADRMGRIIQDLLTLSHLEQDEEKEAIEFTEVRLSGIIKEAVEACTLSAKSKDIKIETFMTEDLTLRANARLLEQALVNLVDNAIKYSEPGLSARMRVELSGGVVVISVEDEGCGIERKHIPRIFERFYRVDKARSRKLGGTGLGLAIVKHVAQVHGGRVGVESTPGKGSIFSLYIPESR